MSVLKNIALLGLGVATVTREKVEEVVEELIKRGEVTSADRTKVIEEIQQKAQAAGSELRKVVDERVEALGKKLRWFEDMNRLKSQVQELTSRIDALEKRAKGSKTRKSKP